MSVSTILQQFASQDLPRSLEIFAPELLLCATILLLLLGRLIGFDRKIPASWIALLGGMVAFTAAFTQFMYLKSGGEPTGVISDLAYVLRITEALNDAASRFINAHPENWFWIHRRFKTRPPGEKEEIYRDG